MTEDPLKKYEIWMNACSVWIAASLVFLGVLMSVNDFSIPSVIPTSLIVSILLFANSMNANAKIIELGALDTDKIEKIANFAEKTFGIGFTLLICSITVITYLFTYPEWWIAWIIIIIAWVILLSYDKIVRGTIVVKKHSFWILIEFLLLIAIWLDFQGIIRWLTSG
jgi:hypothetical protein